MQAVVSEFAAGREPRVIDALRKLKVSARLLIMSYRRKMAFGCLTVLILYCFSFVCFFEVWSDPVQSVHGRWLGPAKRVRPQVTDIGKIHVYQGDDMTLYDVYRPLCVIWLWIMGFR